MWTAFNNGIFRKRSNICSTNSFNIQESKKKTGTERIALQSTEENKQSEIMEIDGQKIPQVLSPINNTENGSQTPKNLLITSQSSLCENAAHEDSISYENSSSKLILQNTQQDLSTDAIEKNQVHLANPIISPSMSIDQPKKCEAKLNQSQQAIIKSRKEKLYIRNYSDICKLTKDFLSFDWIFPNSKQIRGKTMFN